MFVAGRETQFVVVERDVLRGGLLRSGDSGRRALLAVVYFRVAGDVHFVVAQLDGIDEELAILGRSAVRDIDDCDRAAVLLGPSHRQLEFFAGGGQFIGELQDRQRKGAGAHRHEANSDVAVIGDQDRGIDRDDRFDAARFGAKAERQDVAGDGDSRIAHVRRELAAFVGRQLRGEPAVDLFDGEERLPVADLLGVAVERGGAAFELAAAAFQDFGLGAERFLVVRLDLPARRSTRRPAIATSSTMIVSVPIAAMRYLRAMKGSWGRPPIVFPASGGERRGW